MSRHTLTLAACCILLAFFVTSPPVHARQQPDTREKTRTANRLLTPDKIIGDYIRAIGGKRRVAKVRDAVYEWDASGSDVLPGARSRLTVKAPASFLMRFDGNLQKHANAIIEDAATPRTAWSLTGRKKFTDTMPPSANTIITAPTVAGVLFEITTLTGGEAARARLIAVVYASRLLDYKKQNILARTKGMKTFKGESVYEVDLLSRNGELLRLLFNRESKLLMHVTKWEEDMAETIRFEDYRVQDGILEPHRLVTGSEHKDFLQLTLRSVTRNTGISDSEFDPPGENTIDVANLLREVARNQSILDERVSEYTFTRKQTEREINDRGEIKKEKIIVHEVYPVRGGGRVLKLISEDGVALAGDKLAREERRVSEEIEKVERGNAREAAKRDKAKAKRSSGESGAGEDGDADLGVGVFLRACEFVAPRRERFSERDAIVFDFRPRPGFKPSNNSESLVAKLAGIVWIDPVDKQVMRLEARLTDNFKIGGGLVARVRPGSAFVIEQTRLADGVWLPRFSQINASAKVFLLAGFRLDAVREYGDYKRFATEAKDYELKEQ